MDELTKLLVAVDEWLTTDRTIMLYYIFNCAVQSMPNPDSGRLYTWVFKFAHMVAGNINVTRKPFAEKKAK